jgi:hypothetical protein
MTGKKDGLDPESVVIQKPERDLQFKTRRKSRPVGKAADFQLNALGGPLEEDFS